jgi:endonuclease YncB( thermonuclease family)
MHHPAAGLLLALLLAPAAAPAEFFEGRVVGVIDGDTIDVLVGQQKRRVRLFGIDTPERGQPWYAKSKSALSKRVFGKEVRVNDVDRDRHGRTVGEVYADNVCVGCELVREGNAWVYRKYTDDPVLYQLEAEARAARRGLWGLPEAQRVPPWEWRHPGRKLAPAGGSAPPAPRQRRATTSQYRTGGRDSGGPWGGPYLAAKASWAVLTASASTNATSRCS